MTTELMLSMSNKTYNEWIGGTSDWFQCLCGNEPHSDGFYSCLGDGTVVSPTKDGEWDEETYLCIRCQRIIHGESLLVVGVCSEQVAQKNENFDWDKY